MERHWDTTWNRTDDDDADDVPRMITNDDDDDDGDGAPKRQSIVKARTGLLEETAVEPPV